MEKKVIARSKLKEWATEPVTQLVMEALKRKVDECYKNRGEHLLPGEAIKTQENRMYMMGEEDAYRCVWGLIELGEAEIDDLLFNQNIEVVDDK